MKKKTNKGHKRKLEICIMIWHHLSCRFSPFQISALFIIKCVHLTFPGKLPAGKSECHQTFVMISEHSFRWWLVANSRVVKCCWISVFWYWNHISLQEIWSLHKHVPKYWNSGKLLLKCFPGVSSPASGNKSLFEPILSKSYDAIWHHPYPFLD